MKRQTDAAIIGSYTNQQTLVMMSAVLNYITCFKCKQKGHYANEFNNENEEKKDNDDSTIRSTTIASKVLYSNDHSNNKVCHDDDYNIHLDNQSNEHIFRNKNLLSNMRSAKEIQIRGANGETISSNQIGKFLGLEVYYCKNAIANVLSWSKLTNSMRLTWEETRNQFIARRESDDMQLIFHMTQEGLYVCNYNAIQPTMLLTTVSKNMQDYSKREVRDAIRARELSRKLGFTSDNDLIKLINNGSIINCPVTAKDVIMANEIFMQVLRARPQDVFRIHSQRQNLY